MIAGREQLDTVFDLAVVECPTRLLAVMRDSEDIEYRYGHVAGFQAMGEGYGICAKNLGASTLSILLQVELPLLMPAVIAGGSVVFLVAF